jgi:hypothetical protein
MKTRHLKKIARFGYLSRAAIYFVIGGFAALLAFGGSGGTTTDAKGALRKLLEQPMGDLLLIILALGFFSYAAWRILQSLLDYEGKGSDLKGLATRAGFFIGGVSHGMLGLYALNLVTAISPSARGRSETQVTHDILILPAGRFVVAAIGGIILGVGFYQLIRAAKAKYESYLEIPKGNGKWIMAVSRFGLSARGLVFILIGSFFLRAAIKFSSREAGGFRKAWSALNEQPYGDFLVAVVALGLIAFGIYSAVEGFYRRFETGHNAA